MDLDLGRTYENAGQPLKAVDCYHRAAEGPSHDPAAWLRLAVLYTRSGNSAKSAEAFHQAEQLYQLTSNLEGLTEVAYQQGIAADRGARLEDAAGYLRKAIETAHLAGNIHQEFQAKVQLANNAYLGGDNALAESYAREALDTARANQMESLAIRGIVTLGNVYRGRRDFAAAEKSYRDGLALARRSGSLRLEALSIFSLAALHDQMNRSEDTLREAREALAFYEPHRFSLESGQCLILLGRVEQNRGNYLAARESFQRALAIAGEGWRSFSIGNCA